MVAYEAESTLAAVLRRIPSSLGGEVDLEVLVIDDSSRDRTFEVGVRAQVACGFPLTVLFNPRNQGYGGNQKLGYTYAQKNGFDHVVLLHGDGQYAPESIPDLLRPLLAGEADVVLGSRMLLPAAARRGGMPLYKLVGNKILTWFQNRLLGTRLSEFHSGFRAYRVSSLGRIPFQYCANVFHFDTEIIIQMLISGARFVEVPIPTYYGEEICRVNGMRYAKDVALTTLRSRLHRLSLLYSRKFDVEGPANRHYDLKIGFPSSHSFAIDAVPKGSRVLDIGAGPGHVAGELVKKGCVVDGADQWPPSIGAPFRAFQVWKEPGSLEVDLHDYDCVLMLDVIEHLRYPEELLDHLRETARSLEGRPWFIVTTGNVVFLPVRIQALLGNFNYGKRGILDMTHTRLYTFGTLRALFEQSGFGIQRMAGIPAPIPLVLGRGRLSRLLIGLNELLIRIAPGLFSYQIFMIAAPSPTVDALLDNTLGASAQRAATLCGPESGYAGAASAHGPETTLLRKGRR